MTTEESSSPAQPPVQCDFCGRAPRPGRWSRGRPSARQPAGRSRTSAPIASRRATGSSTSTSGRTPLEKLPTPRELVAHLDDYIIGQERVKKTLAVAVVNHYKRLLSGASEIDDPTLKDVEVAKSNVLLIGPTGCGKTALAQTLARRLNVPFAIGDATTLTEAGYVGEDVENLILKLVREADFDIPPAERGIIYIDEIDKIGKTCAERLDHPRRLGRGGAAGAPEAARGDGRQRPAPGGPEAPRAAVPPGRHEQHPVHLRRDVRRPRGDHRQAARAEDDRLRPRARPTATTASSSATSWSRR